MSNIWYGFGVCVLIGLILMMRLGFQTAYLDESAVIDHYAEQYVTTMHDKGIDASLSDCVAVQDESFWIRLRIECDGANIEIYKIGLWGQLVNENSQVFRKNSETLTFNKKDRSPSAEILNSDISKLV